MSKNVRMALLILLPVSFWFATGVLEEDKIEPPKAQKTLSSVVINESIAEMISPTISVNSVAISEKRVAVKAKLQVKSLQQVFDKVNGSKKMSFCVDSA